MDMKSSSGGTAYDFVQPGSDFSQYLHENGYHIPSGTVGDDFYSSGFDENRFEEELAEPTMKRRMNLLNLPPTSMRMRKSSSGNGVLAIKCLFFKTTRWIRSLNLSLPI